MKRRIAFILVLVMVLSTIPLTSASAASKSKKPAQVKNFSVSVSNQTATLKWKKVKKATKYQIYAKVGDSKWFLKKTVKAKTLKTKINVPYAFKTSFKVRAVNGKKKGKFSTVKWIFPTRNSWAIGRWIAYKVIDEDGNSTDVLDTDMDVWVIDVKNDGTAVMTLGDKSYNCGWFDQSGSNMAIYIDSGYFVHSGTGEMMNQYGNLYYLFTKL